MLADLHNHSCLSPCGSLELSPNKLVALAAARGIKALALTDHNTALNCPAFSAACKKNGIIPFYGIEATTSEEIHVVCLFANLDAALAFGDYAYSIITPLPNNPDKTGDQVYVDEDEDIAGELEYFLPSAIDLSIEDIAEKVKHYGGLTIPAHIDRAAMSMTSQLGVVTPGAWDALECVRVPPPGIDTLGYPLISASDAHYPEEVARRPFELDISPEELQPKGPGTEADIEALRRVLNSFYRF